ncbi:MAG: SGNH/GDSL hydrolase family protein [Thermoanaerobaculia bacterium]|nr:SGNH/GDSL hydrolase family protein [Thermoanaerobaculia bacterium]
MRRTILFRLLAAILALVSAAALLEAALRLLPAPAAGREVVVREVPRPAPADEPQFRGPEPDLAAEAFRIVAVGDSFTWGDGVWPEDAYPARIERRLAATEPRVPVQVINWSRRGWNTAQAWRSIEDDLDRLDPDVLVLGYCINDAEPASAERRRELWRELGWWPGDEPAPGWLARNSRLVGRVRTSLLNLRSRRTARAYYHRIYDDGPSWRLNRRALESFGQLGSRPDGPRFLLVIFPIFDSQLDAGYPYRDLHRKVAELAEGEGIATLDLLPAYAGVDARRLAVLPFTDPHPNELAHRIAADRIVEELVARGWAPRGRRAVRLAGGRRFPAED